jgi:hypothetical protein
VPMGVGPEARQVSAFHEVNVCAESRPCLPAEGTFRCRSVMLISHRNVLSTLHVPGATSHCHSDEPENKKSDILVGLFFLSLELFRHTSTKTLHECMVDVRC